jgi:hypothetical protein
LDCACSWFIVSSFGLRERNVFATSVPRGGARAPPPSHSALGRSHNGDPHAKKTFEAAGLDRGAALYRQPGTRRIVRREFEPVQDVAEPPPRPSGTFDTRSV